MILFNLPSCLFPRFFVHKCYWFPPEAAMCGRINSMQLKFQHPCLQPNYTSALRQVAPPPPLPGPQFTYRQEARALTPHNLSLPSSCYLGWSVIVWFELWAWLFQSKGHRQDAVWWSGTEEERSSSCAHWWVPNSPLSDFPRVLKFMIPGHCMSTPYHTPFHSGPPPPPPGSTLKPMEDFLEVSDLTSRPLDI